jgi:hypothetical protein
MGRSISALHLNVLYLHGSILNCMLDGDRSYVTIIVMFAITVGSITPPFVYNCAWNIRSLHILRSVFQSFYIGVGLAIYVAATVIVLISCARRIHAFDMENGFRIITFLKLLKSHLFIFVPPIAIVICQIPYNFLVSKDPPYSSYYQCGISFGEFLIKV